MPYFMLKTILRISNPIAMIRGEPTVLLFPTVDFMFVTQLFLTSSSHNPLAGEASSNGEIVIF